MALHDIAWAESSEHGRPDAPRLPIFGAQLSRQLVEVQRGARAFVFTKPHLPGPVLHGTEHAYYTVGTLLHSEVKN